MTRSWVLIRPAHVSGAFGFEPILEHFDRAGRCRAQADKCRPVSLARVAWSVAPPTLRSVLEMALLELAVDSARVGTGELAQAERENPTMCLVTTRRVSECRRPSLRGSLAPAVLQSLCGRLSGQV
jgi:hypothetical protein